ncbi:MAG: T9SS type A sorting domain-containing protein, partial [Bacteroidota bacterium]
PSDEAHDNFYLVTPSTTPNSDNTDITTNVVEGNTMNASKAHFSVYPNPTKNELNLVLPSVLPTEDSAYQIFNMASGKLVDAGNLMTNRINVSMLESGVYVLKIAVRNDVLTKRFVKS